MAELTAACTGLKVHLDSVAQRAYDFFTKAS